MKDNIKLPRGRNHIGLPPWRTKEKTCSKNKFLQSNSIKAIKFWDSFAGKFEVMTKFSEWRWSKPKEEIFSKATGKVLMVGAGTGNDFKFFPPNVKITAIDFSPKMLNRAKTKIQNSPSPLELKIEDVQTLSFEDESFDSSITSCVFCSVPDPVKGLKEVYRVLKPGGNLAMFEHTDSKNPVLHLALKVMNFFPGPDLTRRTTQFVHDVGFEILEVNYIFQDIVKTIYARKPGKIKAQH